MENPTRLTVAQAAQVLGVSERTLRRRVADGKIEAVKNVTPETGAAWFIERATVEALKASSSNSTELKRDAPREEQEKEEVQALAQVAPELERSAQAQSAEIVRLRDDVQGIKAFLLGQAMAEEGEGLPANLGTVIGQAMRETLAPLVERIEQQSAENALLKQELAQAREIEVETERDLLQLRAQQRLIAEEEAARRRERRSVGAWWPFSKWRE